MVKLVMEINDYNSIENAEIEINKINVVGGVNGSGKSTASKILYSFLKGNSIKRREYALQSIAENINRLIDVLDYEGNDYDLPEPLNIEDEDVVFIEKYNAMLEISKKHDEIAKTKAKKLNKELTDLINDIVDKLENEGYNTDELEFNDNISSNALDLEFFLFTNFPGEFVDEYDMLSKLDDEYSYFLHFGNIHFLCSLNNNLMNTLFNEDTDYLSRSSEFFIREKEYLKDIEDENLTFYLKHNDSKYDPYGYFFDKGFINSVYYVDNVSILDLLNTKEHDSRQLFHMDEIIEDLFESNKKIEYGEDVKTILEKIEGIIKGKYSKYMPVFETNKTKEDRISNKYLNSEEMENNPFLKRAKEIRSKINTYNFNTPSGIKQIGVIQLLLLNDKLKKDGYLIIDEPEVNLHPEWQIKFAEILVLIAKELNITLYLNSHSPMFIEAITLYSQYYDLIKQTNIYLTQESQNDKYIFRKIDPKNMGAVYENLTKPYDELDKLKAEILFKE